MLRRAHLLALCSGLWLGCQPLPIEPPAQCPDCAESPPPDAGAPATPPRAEVKVASFNLKLFFDPVCDSGACGPGDFEKAPTQAEFDARADGLASAISRLGADVVCLQEVENQAAFDALLARLPDHPHAILGEIGYAASVDVAIVSRLPILEVVRHRDRTLYRPDGSYTRFSREFLEVHLDANGQRVVVFAAHFRSKSSDDPGRRWAEATAAHQIAVEVAQRVSPALVVIGGDLNDVPGSPPLEALEADGALVRASAGLPPDQIGTYSWNGVYQAIDHLLVAPAAGGEARTDTFTVLRDDTRGYGGSDHAAIRASFLMPVQP